MSAWYSEGYDKVKEKAKQLEEATSGEYLPQLMLKDGEEAEVTFLGDKPFTYYEHFLKGINRAFTCSQTSDCPLCAIGNKPQFKGAYHVIDHREEKWQDKKTGENKQRKDTLKVAKFPLRALQGLDRKNAKKGLLNYSWTVSRTGTGNNTTYDFEDGQRVPFTMPEKVPTLQEVLKPKSREYLLQVLAQAGQGAPTPQQQPIGNAHDDSDEDEGIVKF